MHKVLLLVGVALIILVSGCTQQVQDPLNVIELSRNENSVNYFAEYDIRSTLTVNSVSESSKLVESVAKIGKNKKIRTYAGPFVLSEIIENETNAFICIYGGTGDIVCIPSDFSLDPIVMIGDLYKNGKIDLQTASQTIQVGERSAICDSIIYEFDSQQLRQISKELAEYLPISHDIDFDADNPIKKASMETCFDRETGIPFLIDSKISYEVKELLGATDVTEESVKRISKLTVYPQSDTANSLFTSDFRIPEGATIINTVESGEGFYDWLIDVSSIADYEKENEN